MRPRHSLISDFARINRASYALRRYLGGVSAQVVAEAP